MTTLVAAPATNAQSKLVEDGEGEIETAYGIDTARFAVGQNRVVFTGHYSRLMRRKRVGGVGLDLLIKGRHNSYLEYFYARLWEDRPGPDWQLVSMIDGRTIRCDWTHRLSGPKKIVKITLPRDCFADVPRFKAIDFTFKSFSRNLERSDSVATRGPVPRG